MKLSQHFTGKRAGLSVLGVTLLLRDTARKSGMTVVISNCGGAVRNAFDRPRFGNLFLLMSPPACQHRQRPL